jgi:hypothetical protein
VIKELERKNERILYYAKEVMKNINRLTTFQEIQKKKDESDRQIKYQNEKGYCGKSEASLRSKANIETAKNQHHKPMR